MQTLLQHSTQVNFIPLQIHFSNFGKEEWIFLNQIAATTNNFIAVNISLKNRTFSAHFRYGPLQEEKL